MKIGPLFKWFGSKWQSAKQYPAPVCNIVIEPYAGSAGYSLNHCDRQVVIYDNDAYVSELWQWLIGEATSQDILEIPLDLPVGTDILGVGLSDGQALLLKHWQRTNNVGHCWTISPWGHLPGQWTANTRARVAEQIHAVKHWIFENVNPVGCRDCTWFIDPPYQYNYQYRNIFDSLKVAELVSALDSTNQVICCEAIGKRGEMPNYLPFSPNHLSVTSRRKSTQSHHSRELIYYRERGK